MSPVRSLPPVVITYAPIYFQIHRLFAQDARTAESVLGLLASKRTDLPAEGRHLE